MPVELGSFDAIISIDWLAKYQAIIVCAEKIVRIPWGNETLIIHGDGKRVSVSKESARNGEWIKIVNEKVYTLLEMEDNDDRKTFLDYLYIDLNYVVEQINNLVSKHRNLVQELNTCKEQLLVLKNELKELTSIAEAWLNSSNKVNHDHFGSKDLVFVKSLADNSKESITSSNKSKLSDAEDSTLSNHDTGKVPSNESQRNTTDHSVVISNSSVTDYDSADESSEYSSKRRGIKPRNPQHVTKKMKNMVAMFIPHLITMTLSGSRKEKLFKLRKLSLSKQGLETASQAIHDAVTTHKVTVSQHFETVSARIDSHADLEDSTYDGVRCSNGILSRRQMCLSADVREDEIGNLKAQLLLRKVEAVEAIHLHDKASNFEAVKTSLQDEMSTLKERNAILEKERNALDVKVTDIEASAISIERELTDLNAMVTSVKSQNDNLADRVHELEDGLSAGITHGKEGRVLTDVAAHNPSTKGNYIAALQRLQNVNFSLLGELKSSKDASIEALMVPIHHSPDKVVIGATALSFALDVSSTEGTAVIVAATMALSTTFDSASSIAPISVDDYEVIGTDD
ncbi:hypothetical protein Tco_1125560 [Tanacetum coccineum]|uniref:Reverse transcriptase domain-containing protein n=1 Tax=Tanacetum coccineum TaxID=301880 RepID=A0ABQ5JAP4_9ASTR